MTCSCFFWCFVVAQWVAKSARGGFINHGHAGHTAATLFTCAREKGILFVPFSQFPFLLGESWASANSNTHFFSHKQEGEEKKRKERQFPLQFSPSLLFFFRVDFCVIFFLSLSLFLSPPSISRWRSQLTWRRREKRRKKNSGGGGVEMDFLAPCFLSLRTRDGRESARGSGQKNSGPSPCRQDSVSLK